MEVERCRDISVPNCVIEETETCTDIVENICEPVRRIEIRLSKGRTCEDLQDEEDKSKEKPVKEPTVKPSDVIDLKSNEVTGAGGLLFDLRTDEEWWSLIKKLAMI